MNTNFIELLNPNRNWKIGTFGHLKSIESNKISITGNLDIKDASSNNNIGFIRGIEPNILIIEPKDISDNYIVSDNIQNIYPNYHSDFSSGILQIKGSIDIEDKLLIKGVPFQFTLNDIVSVNYSKLHPISTISNEYLTNSTDIQDLSNTIFGNLKPSKLISQIIIHLKVNYFCSIAYSERINIQLWRNNTLLHEDNNLGSLNATGGFKNTYSLTIMDEPNNNFNNKYYVKFYLENNFSLIPQGIVDINNSSSIIIHEL